MDVSILIFWIVFLDLYMMIWIFFFIEGDRVNDFTRLLFFEKVLVDELIDGFSYILANLNKFFDSHVDAFHNAKGSLYSVGIRNIEIVMHETPRCILLICFNLVGALSNIEVIVSFAD